MPSPSTSAPTSPTRSLEGRAADPVEPLLRGDELGLPPGPGDRRAAGADRRGAGGRHDLHQGGGTRACPTTHTLKPSASGLRARRRRWSSASAARREHAARGAARASCRWPGNERVLDSGAGTGALALALAPARRQGRRARRRSRAPRPTAGEAADASARRTSCFVDGRRDRACRSSATRSTSPPATGRCTTSPGRSSSISEMARVTRIGGRVLVIDQIAPVDPLAAIELDRFERARDPSHTRLLPDATSGRCSRRTGSCCAPRARSRSRVTSTCTSTWPAARATARDTAAARRALAARRDDRLVSGGEAAAVTRRLPR